MASFGYLVVLLATAAFCLPVFQLATRDTSDFLLPHQQRQMQIDDPSGLDHYNAQPRDHELREDHQDTDRASHEEPKTDYYWPDFHTDLAHGQEEPLAPNLFANRATEKEYLSHELAHQACQLDRGCQRKDSLNNTYLSHCSRYRLDSLLSNQILMSIMHRSTDECEKILDEFIQLDELISQFDHLFKNLLTRYNCHNGYSVKWNCEDCKVSIRFRWSFPAQ